MNRYTCNSCNSGNTYNTCNTCNTCNSGNSGNSCNSYGTCNSNFSLPLSYEQYTYLKNKWNSQMDYNVNDVGTNSKKFKYKIRSWSILSNKSMKKSKNIIKKIWNILTFKK